MFAVAVCGGALLGGPTATAGDCGCAPRESHAVAALPAFKSAFAGRVESVRQDGDSVSATLRVFRAWKGPRDRMLTVATPAGACGVSFQPGSDYLVYATGTKESLRTDACGPTAPLGQSARAVRQLDLHAGYGPNPLRVPPPDPASQARRD